MIKKKVGYQHTCPDSMVQHSEIGGYIFAVSAQRGFLICGSNHFSLTTNPIQPLRIIPVSGEKLKEETSGEGEIADIFELHDDKVYIVVAYGKHSYIFDNLNTACKFGGLIIEYKTNVLKESIIQERLENELR